MVLHFGKQMQAHADSFVLNRLNEYVKLFIQLITVVCFVNIYHVRENYTSNGSTRETMPLRLLRIDNEIRLIQLIQRDEQSFQE